MNIDAMPFKKVHHGRNVKRLREILGVKQDAIAIELDMTQQNFSRLEQKEEIEDALLERVANILRVPVEAIKNFDEEATISFVSNTFNDTFNGNSSFMNYYSGSNSIDKIIELYEDKINLYERMLEMEREKNNK